MKQIGYEPLVERWEQLLQADGICRGMDTYEPWTQERPGEGVRSEADSVICVFPSAQEAFPT